MLGKIRPIPPFLIAVLTLLLFSGLANAQNATRGWDGKGKLIVTAVSVKFDDPADFDSFAAGKLPINFTLKNTASGQTIALASRLVSQGFKPSQDKSEIVVYVTIDNLTAPVWDDKGCVDTRTSAENAAGGEGVNITLTYAACGGPAGSTGAQKSAGAPLKGVDVKLGKSDAARNAGGRNMTVTFGGSEVAENSAEYFKLKINPSGNNKNIIIVSSSKGSGSPKQQGF